MKTKKMHRMQDGLSIRPMMVFALFILLQGAATASVRTWTGLAGNTTWTNDLNWTDNNAPNTEEEDALIDGNAGQNVTVALTILTNITVSCGSVTVDAGDTVSIAKVSMPGGATFRATNAVANAGTLTFGGSSTATSHGHSFSAYVLGGAGGTFNAASGKFYAKSLTGFRRNSVYVQIPASNTNNGIVYVQNVSSQGAGKVRLSLAGSGHSTFVNNGTVNVEGSGSDNSAGGNQPWAVFGPGTASAYLTLAGNGTVRIQSNLSVQPDSFAHLSGLATGTTLTNSATHNIIGNGYIGWNGTDGASGNTITSYKFTAVVNHGLIQASRSANWAQFLIQPIGGNIINASSGRMIASGSSGTIMRIGSNPVNAGTFTNDGRLEAYTGCSVWLATNVTSVLRGEIRGGGTFIGSPTLTLSSTTLMPGDSVNTNGTGASTIGALTVTGNLVMADTTTLEVQLGEAGTAGVDYDTVAVSGSLTLNGTVNISDAENVGDDVSYRIISFTPNSVVNNVMTVGTVPPGLPVPQVVVDNAAGTVSLYFPPRRTVIIIR